MSNTNESIKVRVGSTVRLLRGMRKGELVKVTGVSTAIGLPVYVTFCNELGQNVCGTSDFEVIEF